MRLDTSSVGLDKTISKVPVAGEENLGSQAAEFENLFKSKSKNDAHADAKADGSESGTSKSDIAQMIAALIGELPEIIGDLTGGTGSEGSQGVSSSSGQGSTEVNRVTGDKTMDQFISTPPTADTKRPEGDTRSAEQIIDDNPVLKNLGNQSDIKDKLNKLVGGNMESDPDQAYRAAALLTYIKSSNSSAGDDRGSIVSDGKIDGFTKDGDARHGTEAGVLQDVANQGFGYLNQLPNHQLPTTSDSHVNADGSNMDNLKWGWDKIGAPIASAVGDIVGLIPK